jgi:hypothetical protein
MDGTPHRKFGADMSCLKISDDPLFGVMAYDLALYYEVDLPTLAVFTRERPFPELNLSTLSLEGRREVVDTPIGRLRNLDTAAIAQWLEEPGPVERRGQNLQQYEDSKRYLLDPAHADAHIHLLNAWRRWSDPQELAQAEVPVFTCGRWLHRHFAPYTAREHAWCGYVERWLRVIANWPMQSSFAESAFRLHEALRGIPKAGTRAPLVVS